MDFAAEITLAEPATVFVASHYRFVVIESLAVAEPEQAVADDWVNVRPLVAPLASVRVVVVETSDIITSSAMSIGAAAPVLDRPYHGCVTSVEA